MNTVIPEDTVMVEQSYNDSEWEHHRRMPMVNGRPDYRIKDTEGRLIPYGMTVDTMPL